MMYFIGWSLFFIFFKCYLGFKVVGRENIPKIGNFIFASNHVSYFDPILLGTSIHRSLNYMARETLFNKPCFGWIMRKMHAFPVKRGEGDYAAIKESLRILGSGKPLVMFPEGTRSKDRNLRHAKPGIGFLAARSGVLVIPAYIEGSFDALSGGLKTLLRHQVKVYIGKPIKFDKKYPDKKDRAIYQKMSDEIMENIAGLKKLYGAS